MFENYRGTMLFKSRQANDEVPFALPRLPGLRARLRLWRRARHGLRARPGLPRVAAAAQAQHQRRRQRRLALPLILSRTPSILTVL